MLLLVVQSSKVQTAMLGVVAKELSKQLDTHISVEKIDYSFPNKVGVYNIYVEDQQQDTLLYVDSLEAKFNFVGFFEKKIIFRHATFKTAYANAYRLDNTSNKYNYDFIIDLFPKKKDNSSGMEEIIEVKNVSIRDIRLRYDDWRIKKLDADISLNRFSKDSLDAQISHLYILEKEGFCLNDLQLRGILTHNKAQINNLLLQLPHSSVMLDGFVEHTTESDSTETNMFKRLFDMQRIESAQAYLNIERAIIRPSDIGRFVPQVRNINGDINFSTQIKGTIGDIFADDLSLDYKNQPIIRGDVSFYGLPNLDTSYIHAQLQDLTIDHALLQDFISDIKNKPFSLPQEIARMGKMHYGGILDGRLDSLTLNGTFTSRVGNITTNGYLIIDTIKSISNFRGIVSTPRFMLGHLLGQKDLGALSMTAQVDGRWGEKLPLEAKLKSIIKSFQYKGYTYKNTHINGEYHKNEFNGQIDINDPNVQLAFDGMVDFTEELPIANFNMQLGKLKLGELNLTDKYPDMDISTQITINASGNNLDNINGYLYIDSLHIMRGEKELLMHQMRIMAETGDNEPTNLKINSDFLNANFSGEYKYSMLPLAAARLIAKHVPRMLTLKTRRKLEEIPPQNEFNYYMYFKNLDSIFNIFDIPVSLSMMPTIKGSLNEKTEQFSLQAGVPNFKYGKINIKDITLNFDNKSEQLNLDLYLYKKAGKSIAEKRIGDLELKLTSLARHDSLYLTLGFESKDSIRHAGQLLTQTRFMQYAGKPLADLHFLPSAITISDSKWFVDDSHIIYSVADTSLQVNNFRIGNDEHFIYADGLASRRETDSVFVELREIVLDPLLEYTNVKKSIEFGGAVTGWAKAFALFKSPAFEADVKMKDAQINGVTMGDVHGIAWLDRSDLTIGIWGALVENGDTVAKVDGLVEPLQKKWGIDIYPDSANLTFINGWTQGILDISAGRGYGWVHVFGEGKLTWLEGEAFAKDAELGIPILGTKYHFSDSVSMDLESIRFNNIKMFDDKNNTLLVNGKLEHENFKKLKYQIDVDCNKTHVMSLAENIKDMFYGNIYASAKVHIRGDEQECRIFADAKTENNTSFAISLGTASNARDNSSFITFVDHSLPSKNDDDEKEEIKYKPKTKVLINLQIEATPAAEFNLIIDPRTGDRLKARGEGNIRFEYNVNQDDIKLYGTYQLLSGTFSFTLENFIRKQFKLREGSKVTFAGDPMNLYIDASAHYATSASLRDLFGPDITQMSITSNSVPVNCIIYLKGQLSNPTISFGIELPQAEETLASQVRSVINTEEMIMREVLYLLVFNKFYTPEYLQTNTTTGLNETYSLISSTITGQINDWLRKLTNNFTIGFNIRQDGEGKDAAQEYETQFQYQPNNRLIINGNFGYRYNDISNQPIFGNLDVEYLLSPSGMWRAKAYTHMVDKYSLRNAHTMQGVGLMFKYDFNAKSKKAKKEKTNEVAEENQQDIIQTKDITNQDVSKDL
ncbi:MAG: translocation/assembly module TamB domain-containing protein [Paludibacteraceae bacterium]|nr:translocation/assembly module TamB domain-containing protein [Paludibacteraceae bacterium]